MYLDFDDRVAALPRDIREDNCFIQMKLSSSPFAPLLMFVLEWMDCSCFDTFLTCLGLFHVLVYQVSYHSCKLYYKSYILKIFEG